MLTNVNRMQFNCAHTPDRYVLLITVGGVGGDGGDFSQTGLITLDLDTFLFIYR